MSAADAALVTDWPVTGPGAWLPAGCGAAARGLTPTGLLRCSPGRPEAEAFVARAFRVKHGASIQSFMPELVSFRDGRDRVRGVVGLRSAAREPLYLEHYLDVPVESAIATCAGVVAGRGEIVEVGNLAGRHCRDAVSIVATLPEFLLERGYRWIVFTATVAVQQILHSFGAPLTELARAEQDRVRGGLDDWGRYYVAKPRVFAGYLPDSRHIAGFGHGGSHD
ncbi:MAG TPA: thermostable hemolysin [Steroidobacteraceae bacterium]|nr:thermostable hemolysin [Steroidobacteraceae bacterium]